MPSDEKIQRPAGGYGPNDNGHINHLTRLASELLQRATYVRHEPPDWRDIQIRTRLHRALAILAEVDKETAQFANKTHDPALFTPCRPNDGCEVEFRTEYFQLPPPPPKDHRVVADDGHLNPAGIRVRPMPEDVFSIPNPVYPRDVTASGPDQQPGVA